MAYTSPLVVVLAGPNGAGKTTAAPRLLLGALELNEFVNADTIAQGLSAFHPDDAAITVRPRIMLERLPALARDRETFAFETTLATRNFAPGCVLFVSKVTASIWPSFLTLCGHGGGACARTGPRWRSRRNGRRSTQAI